MVLLLFSACTPAHKETVDKLNSLSYAYHYRDLDSTKSLAMRALSLSSGYDEGYAEACNNLAFYEIAKLNYGKARKWLDLVENKCNNQIELLIADVQNMRICQRESHNKDFYAYREKAKRRLHRIGEEMDNLPPRERRRMVYAQSEFSLIEAVYFYYVGLEKPMLKSLHDIDVDVLEQDTAQYLNYLYNVGAGGAITEGTSQQIAQTEFDYLVQCYMLASVNGNAYPYFQANALQAISEHLQSPSGKYLIKNNQPAIKYLNVEQMPDSLLAGNFAQQALNLFSLYGDVYQVAGGYRTLAECYFAIKDYRSAGNCLLHALNDNKAINKSPELVASIREQLCLVYSAIDDKQKSDYNRNIYLDLQEQTRQDRQLEARAAQLDTNAIQLNLMIFAVVSMIVIVVLLLYLFHRMRLKKDKENPMANLLQPLQEWKTMNEQHINEIEEKNEEMDESLVIARSHLSANKQRNLEHRARLSLVNSITPFIDRMIHEVDRLCDGKDSEEVKKERYQYILELTGKINQYNQVLTQWIQMRQGELSLRIESFPLQSILDIIQKGKMSFQMKGILLSVESSTSWVKADKTLTLFMINTMADNARKFTENGGQVSVRAQEMPDRVVISISDTGKGMDEEQLSHVFDRTYTGGHGFGLLNCKGIIEKYKKVSSIFKVCDIKVESEVGKGSIFSFTLPKGVKRALSLMLFFLLSIGMTTLPMMAAKNSHHLHHDQSAVNSALLQRADDYADSTYFSNINGTYDKTLRMADSAIHYLNEYYLSVHPHGKMLMKLHPQGEEIAEQEWFQDSLPTNYNVILDVRNECAVAALALHRWELYKVNNQIYTHLFRERSADATLDDYVRTMQQAENSKTVAIIMLLILLLQLPFAYYFVYYRHVLAYNYAVETVNSINKLLLSKVGDEEKLAKISKLWDRQERQPSISPMLVEVVTQIKNALHMSIVNSKNEAYNMELKEDELRCVEFENSKLHVSNSVLDNCFSTLKHETMYYPSRIQQLVEENPDDMESLRETVDYYKSLYSMLSMQAMEQVHGTLRCDGELKAELSRLLLGKTPRSAISVMEKDVSPTYVSYHIIMENVVYDELVHSLLFTPLTIDLRYLLCRQIIREIGEVTNLRGSGIQARASEDGHLMIVMVLPRKIHYKL